MEKHITVLYVDDEQINLIMFELGFNKYYHVITALSGDEGLEKMTEYKDDIIVVVSDMRMPGMDGIDFIAKAREKYNNIAYFILTGYEYNDKIDAAMKEGLIHRFFTKPFNIKEILSAIDESIEQLHLLDK